MFFRQWTRRHAHCDQLESAGATGDYDEDVSAYSQHWTIVRQHACTVSGQDLSWLCVEWMSEICRYVFQFHVGSNDCAVFLPDCISDRLPPRHFRRFEQDFGRPLPGFLAVVPSESIRLIILQSCPWVGLTRGLGWAWLGWVGSGSEIFVFSGLGWVMGLKWQICEKWKSCM